MSEFFQKIIVEFSQNSPFPVKHTAQMEFRMASGSDPLIDEHRHIFTSNSEDSFVEHISAD